jgi:hypothetical protein
MNGSMFAVGTNEARNPGDMPTRDFRLVPDGELTDAVGRALFQRRRSESDGRRNC